MMFNTSSYSYFLLPQVMCHDIIELPDKQLCALPSEKFDNLLDLIRFYKGNNTLGHKLTRPCCVSVWHQRGHLSHPPQILASLA